MVTVLQKSSTRELSWSTGQNHCCANTDVHENRVAQMVDTRTVTDNSLPSIAFHRSNVNRGTSNVFLQFFFIHIYERKKERNTKRKEIDESRGEVVRCVRLSKISWRKENLFFGKKKKMKFLDLKFLSTLHVASLLCPCKILDSLFLDTDFASFGRINNREDCISRAIFLAR